MSRNPFRRLAPAILAPLLLLLLLSCSYMEEKPYTIAFGEDFSPGLALRDDLGISLVVAVDVSGSMADAPAMGGKAKYLQASEALVEVMRVVERLAKASPAGQVLKVGLIRFDDAVETVLPLAVMDKAGLADFKRAVRDRDSFRPGGTTAIGLALERGAEMLAQSGTVLRSLIVITDGENTAGVEPALSLDAIYADRNSAATPEVPVSTKTTLISFIGFDIDASVFGSFAALGARVTSAGDRDELARVLSGILEADITRLEAPSLGAGVNE